MPLKIRHPDIDALGEAVNEHQFRVVWQPRGWELVPPEVQLAVDHFSRSIGSLDDLTRDELAELAAVQSIDVQSKSSKATKAEIIAAITKSPVVEAIADPESTSEVEP